MKMGAIVAETSVENAELIYGLIKFRFGFSITRHYLDALAKLWKASRGDIIENKKTYLYQKLSRFLQKEAIQHLFSMQLEDN
jgi:geranylgeranyl diphosphate synthase type II